MNKLIDLNLLKQFKMNLDKKITKLDEEQDRKVEAALAEVNGRVEDLSANFTMAANSIGDVLVAKGLSVPIGTTLEQMAELIQNDMMKTIKRQKGSIRFGRKDNGITEHLITFPNPFPSAPKVTVGPVICTYVPGDSQYMTTSYKNVTQNSFIIVVNKTNGGNSFIQDMYVEWLAYIN